MIVHHTEGETEELPFLLQSDGAPPTLPLTGTVVLALHDVLGALVDTSGDVRIIDPLLWKVGYRPDAADMIESKSPYTAHFLVTQGGDTFAFPKGPAFTIRVYRQ